MHCALETRYNRYIVVNQQLNPLQISYRPVTPVTLLSINNLVGYGGNIFTFLPAAPPFHPRDRIWTRVLQPSAKNRITNPRTERQQTRSALTGPDTFPRRQPRAAPATYSGWPQRKPNI
jgi:hypothetical protein